MWNQSPTQKMCVVTCCEFLKCEWRRGAAKGPLFFLLDGVFGQRHVAEKCVNTSCDWFTMLIKLAKVSITIIFSAKTLKNRCKQAAKYTYP